MAMVPEHPPRPLPGSPSAAAGPAWAPTVTPAGSSLDRLEPWLRATVVVDVMNVAMAIDPSRRDGGTEQDGAVRPSLERIRAVLRHFGIEAERIVPVLPTERLRRLVDDGTGDRMGRVERARAWVEAWVEESGPGVRDDVLAGAYHHGEVGVDELCVAATLLALWRDGAGAVVLMSRDADVLAAAEVAGAPVLAVHRFEGRKRRGLRAHRIAHLSLPRHSLRALGAGSAVQPSDLQRVRIAEHRGELRVHDVGGPISAHRSSDLRGGSDRGFVTDLEQVRAGREALALVDTHGLMGSAATAVGAARHPLPGDVTAVLEDIGLHGCAQFAIVPDLFGDDRPRIELGRSQRNGLAAEDEHLDSVVTAYVNDRDPSTRARRARQLVPGRDPETVLNEKQTSTLLTAALLWALLHPRPRVGHGTIVLLSDRPALALVLERLETMGLHGLDHVIRVGVHADPIDVTTASYEERIAAWQRRGTGPASTTDEVRNAVGTRSGAHLVVLDGRLVERLVGLGATATARRAAAELLQAATDPDVRWRFLRYDPAIAGCVLVSVGTDTPVRLRVEGAWAVDAEVWAELERGTQVPGSELDATLVIDPARPCESPWLIAIDRHDPPEGARDARRLAAVTRAAVRLGRALRRRPGAIEIDLDHDGEPDAAVPAPHDAVRNGDLLHLHGTGTDLRIVGIERPDDGGSSEELGAILTVTMVGADRAVADGQDGAVEDAVDILPLVPGPPLPRSGQRLLASRLEDGRLQALSTALPHLDPVGSAPGPGVR